LDADVGGASGQTLVRRSRAVRALPSFALVQKFTVGRKRRKQIDSTYRRRATSRLYPQAATRTQNTKLIISQ
jgi:hypothetical protein